VGRGRELAETGWVSVKSALSWSTVSKTSCLAEVEAPLGRTDSTTVASVRILFVSGLIRPPIT
jgi:hypothetical protein